MTHLWILLALQTLDAPPTVTWVLSAVGCVGGVLSLVGVGVGWGKFTERIKNVKEDVATRASKDDVVNMKQDLESRATKDEVAGLRDAINATRKDVGRVLNLLLEERRS